MCIPGLCVWDPGPSRSPPTNKPDLAGKNWATKRVHGREYHHRNPLEFHGSNPLDLFIFIGDASAPPSARLRTFMSFTMLYDEASERTHAVYVEIPTFNPHSSTDRRPLCENQGAKSYHQSDV